MGQMAMATGHGGWQITHTSGAGGPDWWVAVGTADGGRKEGAKGQFSAQTGTSGNTSKGVASVVCDCC